MTTSAKTPYSIPDHKQFCSRHTLLLSGGEILCRGEAALEEYLRRVQGVTP